MKMAGGSHCARRLRRPGPHAGVLQPSPVPSHDLLGLDFGDGLSNFGRRPGGRATVPTHEPSYTAQR
eukprot:13335767-Alexandrium_andersonii.AAC.1